MAKAVVTCRMLGSWDFEARLARATAELLALSSVSSLRFLCCNLVPSEDDTKRVKAAHSTCERGPGTGRVQEGLCLESPTAQAPECRRNGSLRAEELREGVSEEPVLGCSQEHSGLFFPHAISP